MFSAILDAGSNDFFNPHADTVYQEQIEYVANESARLFQYWITKSGVHDESDIDHVRRGVEHMYTKSSYAFDHHLMLLRQLFDYGEPLFGILDHLLMQSIQTKWGTSGCPWIFDTPTEYDMAFSQIDWIFQVVGKHMSTRSTGMLESTNPEKFYTYQDSLYILRTIVVRLVQHEKRSRRAI